MSVLRKLEEKIQGLFEGGFGRAFKSPVQPVELARKLVKEMEEHKVISVSRVYAPNEYTLFLSEEDSGHFEAYRDRLAADLAEYLLENARRERYEFISRPVILFETDEDLQEGEFGIATRMVSGPEAEAEAPAGDAARGETVVYRPPAPAEGTMSVGAEEAERLGLAHERVTLAVGGKVFEVEKRVVLIGRSRESDLVLPDRNVSRRHAELRRQNGDYVIVDLGSMNGTEVNGRRIKSRTLKNGDTITMGTTRVRFERQIC